MANLTDPLVLGIALTSLLGVTAIGLWAGRQTRSVDDFYVAGASTRTLDDGSSHHVIGL